MSTSHCFQTSSFYWDIVKEVSYVEIRPVRDYDKVLQDTTKVGIIYLMVKRFRALVIKLTK